MLKLPPPTTLKPADANVELEPTSVPEANEATAREANEEQLLQ